MILSFIDLMYTILKPFVLCGEELIIAEKQDGVKSKQLYKIRC